MYFSKTATKIGSSRNQKKTSNPIINPETSLEVEKNVFISVPYGTGLNEEFRRISHHTSVWALFKGTNS